MTEIHCSDCGRRRSLRVGDCQDTGNCIEFLKAKVASLQDCLRHVLAGKVLKRGDRVRFRPAAKRFACLSGTFGRIDPDDGMALVSHEQQPDDFFARVPLVDIELEPTEQAADSAPICDGGSKPWNPLRPFSHRDDCPLSNEPPK